MMVGLNTGEVCLCGHPAIAHQANGKCEMGRINCMCNRTSILLVTNRLDSFRHDHGRGTIGHALMQGVIESFGETTISRSQSSQEFRCFKCKRLGWELAPVLMDTHSRHISDNPEQGRMSRLWCGECLAQSGRDFPPYLGYLVFRELYGRNHPDS
jgi:hypothetical protein